MSLRFPAGARRGSGIPWLLALVSMLIICQPSVQSQKPPSIISDLFHTAWTADDGLPSPVNTIAQTTDGYLWVGTQSGLIRFDGVRFQRFEPPEFPELPSTDIEFLRAAPDGSLWVGYHAGGVTEINGTKITNFGEADGLSSTQIIGFAMDEEGTLWAGTSSGLKRFAKGRWSSVGPDWNLPLGTVAYPLLDPQGRIWVMQRNAVYDLAPGSHTFVRHELPLRGDELRDLIPFSDGTVWAGIAKTSLGDYKRLFPLSDPAPRQGRQNSPALKIMLSGRESDIFREDSGTLLVASPSGGIIRIPDQTFLDPRIRDKNADRLQHFAKIDGLSGDEVRTIFRDREGNIWTGTNLGLDRFRRKSVFKVPLPIQNGSAIVEMGTSTIWAAGPDAVFSISDRTVSRLARPSNAYCMYRAGDGTVWIGGYGTLSYNDRGHLEDVALPDGISINNPSFVRAITRDISGAIWISIVQHGVYKLSGRSWQHYGDIKDLPKLTPVVLWSDQRGGVWFGYLDGRVARLNNDKVKIISASNGLDLGNVTALNGNADDVWVGGQHGVSLIRDGHVHALTTEQDNLLLSISGIVETANGDLWVYGANGLLHMSGSEIEKQLREPQFRLHADVFDRRDGLPGIPSQFSHLPSEILSTTGKIWLSGSGGVAWVNPANVSRDPSPPPVLIQRMYADGHSYSIPSGITLPPLIPNVQIDYTSTDLSIPERIRFRYKLDGVDADWQEVGPRRQAFYTHLAPGHYTFHVSARTGDGNWNVNGAATSFRVAPAYYQTIWFEGLCAVGGLAFLWLLYKIRVWQIAHALSSRFDERLAERTRIASDLHDTLLQTIDVSKLVAQDAAAENYDDLKMRRALEKLSAWLEKASQEARAAVKSLRSSTMPGNDLAAALQHSIDNDSNNGSLAASFSVVGAAREIHPIVKDETYCIGYEAIRNAQAHSAGTLLKVELKFDGDLELRIRDNGVGMDSAVREHGKENHFGLEGMRERAANIGGKLTITSSSISGTEVVLVVPASIAFVDAKSHLRARIQRLLLRKRHPRSLIER
jgi:ligand-binding sensor domain-containing protein